jgi:hypothetical protein
MLTVSFQVSDKHLEETENVLLAEELYTFINWCSIMHSKQNIGYIGKKSTHYNIWEPAMGKLGTCHPRISEKS